MSPRPESYLTRLYYWLVALGLASAALILALAGWTTALSFSAGFLAILTMLVLWHLTISIGTRGERPRAIWVGVLVILRYALIGGMLYAIMRVLGGRIQLEWAWFFAGICTFLPSLVLNDLTTGKDS